MTNEGIAKQALYYESYGCCHRGIPWERCNELLKWEQGSYPTPWVEEEEEEEDPFE
jgi:hypothetical protein